MSETAELRILYIGDVMGRPGREVLARLLPELRRTLKPDLIIAQGENVTHGKGISPAHLHELTALGVQFFTGGNHTIERVAIKPFLEDPLQPIIAPINQPGVQPEWGAKIVQTAKGPVQIASLLGTVFPHLHEPIGN